MSIYFHFDKIISHYHLYIASLLKQHTINFILDEYYFKKAISHYMAINYLISKQCLKIKSSIMNTNNCLSKVFPSFNSLNTELFLGFYIVDTVITY